MVVVVSIDILRRGGEGFEGSRVFVCGICCCGCCNRDKVSVVDGLWRARAKYLFWIARLFRGFSTELVRLGAAEMVNVWKFLRWSSLAGERLSIMCFSPKISGWGKLGVIESCAGS